MSIIIDREFKDLIPPLSEEEYRQLEENCVNEGIRDAVTVWDQHDGNVILVDGHNRFDIAAKHGLELRQSKKDFQNREEVKLWIIQNQFGRRNLSAYDRSLLALKLKPLIAEQAHERKVEHVQNSAQAKTRDQIATIAGVSHDTIAKVEKIEAAATDRTKQLVREGKLSINQAFNSVHPKRPDPVKVAKEEHEQFQQKKESAVVNFQEIQTDKINQKIINSEMKKELANLINEILRFGSEHKTEEIEKVFSKEDEYRVSIISEELKNCISVIAKISLVINRRNTNAKH